MPEYQSLYRKYRSQTFADLVGQEAASRALQGAIISGRVAHAYLFSGSRGTGKTSAARLLAKALNCSGRKRDSAEPCNRCESCLEMTAGSALDLIEIDAASNRGIDDVRDLREKVNLAPARGPYKIYIIDESHGLTGDAFNALLKTLEEPPPHAVFVMCTTDAQKMPLTVIGRCQHFVFRRHGEEQIAARLAHIAKAEGVQVDADAMQLIARTAQGSMRDAVGLLDQLVPLASGPITLESARSLLGIADPRLLDGLLDDVLVGRAAEALAELDRIYAAGGELRQVVRGLMEGCRDRLLTALTERDHPTARRLSSVLEALLHLDGEVRRHAEPRFLVEATLARLAVELGTESHAARAEAATARQPTVQPRADRVAEVPVAPRPARPDPVPASATPVPVAPAAPAPAPMPAPIAPLPLAGWSDVLEKLNRTVRAVYLDAQPEVDGATLILWFKYGFHHKKAQEQSMHLMPHVRGWLGDGITVEYRLRETEPAKAGAPRPASPEDDPFVREVVRRFDGRVTRVKEVSE
ncbi:MAG TPA: DNA polymerase III subunit gamma/tau [Candidatus Dormibacteraeota bacterium]